MQLRSFQSQAFATFPVAKAKYPIKGRSGRETASQFESRVQRGEAGTASGQGGWPLAPSIRRER